MNAFLRNRLNVLAKLEDGDTVDRRVDEIDGEIQNSYVVYSDDFQRWVQFCEKTGLVVAYGDRYDEFTLTAEKLDCDNTSWVSEKLGEVR